MKSKGKTIDKLKEGEWTYFNPDGTTFCRGKYKKGEKIGEWVFFEKNRLCEKGIFINDLKEGNWEFLYSSGKRLGVGKYVSGKRDGDWIAYYEDGKIRTKQFYINGNKEGKWEWYNINGKLEILGEYLNNKETENWKYLGKNGIFKEATFDSIFFDLTINNLESEHSGLGLNNYVTHYLFPFKGSNIVTKVKQKKIEDKVKRNSIIDENRTCPACQNSIPCGCNWSDEQY